MLHRQLLVGNPQELDWDETICYNCKSRLDLSKLIIPGTSEFEGYCSEQCRAESEGEVH